MFSAALALVSSAVYRPKGAHLVRVGVRVRVRVGVGVGVGVRVGVRARVRVGLARTSTRGWRTASHGVITR